MNTFANLYMALALILPGLMLAQTPAQIAPQPEHKLISSKQPATFLYQGYLTDIHGNALLDGTYEITFQLYDQGPSRANSLERNKTSPSPRWHLLAALGPRTQPRIGRPSPEPDSSASNSEAKTKSSSAPSSALYPSAS